MADAVDGVVEAVRPQGLYEVRCDNGRFLLASLTPGGRKAVIKFIPGDRVSVEISEFDPTRGRIQGRL
jgi:translation initiation factor IF-1